MVKCGELTNGRISEHLSPRRNLEFELLGQNTSIMASKSTAPGRRVFSGVQLPLAYRLFFLIVEPAAALVGAYYAHFRPLDYLSLTHAASAPNAAGAVPLGTAIALSQLANLYLFFAVNEALVLRSTGDLRVWKTVLFCLLVGDVGHLYTVRELGVEVYYGVWGWNSIDWGNVAFVYVGMAMRVAFLAGVGLSGYAARKRQ